MREDCGIGKYTEYTISANGENWVPVRSGETPNVRVFVKGSPGEQLFRRLPEIKADQQSASVKKRKIA